MRLRQVTLVVIFALGLLAVPLPVEPQQAGKVYRIGYLFSRIAARDKSLLAAFRQGLQELGYLEGKNIVIEQRYGKRHRLPALVAELVRLKVDLIVTSPSGVRDAKKASSTIPIVMTYSADPVGGGLVASLAHPGANVTGLSDYHGDLGAKRLELLKEVVPLASRVAVLFNPNSGPSRRMLKDVQAVAAALGVTVLPLEFKGPDDVDHAFATIRKERPGGLLQTVLVTLIGKSDGTTITGTVRSLNPVNRVQCRNRTTGAKAIGNVSLPNWDCGSLPLPTSGDNVQVKIKGTTLVVN